MSCEDSTGRADQEDACRLLIVDDDLDTLKFMTLALRDLGHEMETARNGTEALMVAATFLPHIVLIDINLPGLDGYYVTRELRKIDDGILVIAITGRRSPDDFHRSKEAGCDHHLVKPVDVEQLTGMLERWKAKGGCETAPDVA